MFKENVILVKKAKIRDIKVLKNFLVHSKIIKYPTVKP